MIFLELFLGLFNRRLGKSEPDDSPLRKRKRRRVCRDFSPTGFSECSSTAESIPRYGTGNALTKRSCLRPRATINMLSEETVVEIFYWYLGEDPDDLEINAWCPLVQVCRRWRKTIFRLPSRLNLRLLYTARPNIPAHEILDVWPAFPIIIQVQDINDCTGSARRQWSWLNVVAALKYKDRIRKIQLVNIKEQELEQIFLEMEETFPELTDLVVTSPMLGEEAPFFFLDKSAPRLRSLKLESISYSNLSDLVSSARNLVELSILKLPTTWYIPPQKLVTMLSELTRLETLSWAFDICDVNLDTEYLRHSAVPYPTSRYVLPSLKSCLFQGIYEYMQDFVAMIDTPNLENIDITLCKYESYQPSDVDERKFEFNRFLNRTKMFKTLNNASIRLCHDKLEITLSQKPWAFNAKLTLNVLCQEKIRCLWLVCRRDFRPLFNIKSHANIKALAKINALASIKSLGISSEYHKWQRNWDANVQDKLWLRALVLFSAVETLYLSKDILPSVACGVVSVMDLKKGIRVLPGLLEMSTDTAKPLRSGSVRRAVEGFIKLHGLSALHPPTVPFSWVAEQNASSPASNL